METKLKSSINNVDLEELAGVIKGGGVVVLPTDTIYGIHCAVSCREAVRRIREVKGRSSEKGFILLASDIKMVDGVVSAWPQGVKERLQKIWPAPLTAVLPPSDSLPTGVVSKGGVAVRVPASAWLRKLILMVGVPLVSTSVNRSGCKPLVRIADIVKQFPTFDFYVSSPGRASRAPSTLVDFMGNRPRVLRRGRYKFKLD